MAQPPISGQIIYRQLTEQDGLREITASFSTLEELFQLVVFPQPTYLVDRINLMGVDTQAQHRLVSFVFRSIQILAEP